MEFVEAPHYYLYSVLLLALVFIAGLLAFSKHYKIILFSSLMALPQSLLSPLVVPEYWDPEMHLLFGLVGMEDLAFSFFTGGLVWIGILMSPFNTNHSYRISPGPVFQRFALCSIFGISTISLLYLLGVRSLYNPIIVMGLWILLCLMNRKDYLPVAVSGSLVFLAIYAVVFKVSLLIWPEFILFWSAENLSGIYPLGIPLEELVWAFLYGGAWSLGIAYILGFNMKDPVRTLLS